MKKLLIILGPTATGKTDLAIKIAQRLNGEIIACDSRQVYKGLDIGTGKYPGNNNFKVVKNNGFWEINGLKIRLYDLVDLATQYTAFNYVNDASKKIEEINGRNKLPIIVGGTGLYLKVLLSGLSQTDVNLDESLRQELDSLSVKELQIKLKEISEEKFLQLNESDIKNKRRLIRAIEQLTTSQAEVGRFIGIKDKYDTYFVGLNLPREKLYEKINQRALSWVEDGIIEEVSSLLSQGISEERIKSLGLEYREVTAYFKKTINKETLIKNMQTKTRNYAKRQLTYFNNVFKNLPINWFDVSDKKYSDEVVKEIEHWYNRN